jgi:hypothetical protein
MDGGNISHYNGRVKTLLPILIGAVLGVGFARVVSSRPPEQAKRVYALGLLVTGLIYVLFPIAGGVGGKWLVLEIAGAIVYGVAAWVGFSRWPMALAIGWIGHSAWDLLLHLKCAGAAYTPDWYPWACLSFDVIVGFALMREIISRSGAYRERV